MIDLSGKHIFVAGGSRGIGRATALLAARAGAKVSINYVSNQNAAQETVSEIQEIGSNAVAIGADIAVEGEAERAVTEAVSVLGPLQGLVISAGIFEGTSIESMTGAFWDRTMTINLRGTFLVVQGGRQADAGA